MKVLYFDTETTGLYPKVHEIVQLAAIIEIDGIAIDQINLEFQPTNWASISPEALNVNKRSVDMLMTYQKPQEAFKKFQAFLDKYIDKYDYNDKAYPSGHNVTFDIDFVQDFFKKYGNSYGFGSYQNWRILDTRILANFLIADGLINPVNIKLETLCKIYDIPLDAHDALNDIRATRQLYKAMIEHLKRGNNA